MEDRSRTPMSTAPAEMCLLLRVDAEQRWLHREVIPVLRELEEPRQLGERDAGAALAYLEAMWSQAAVRARATDAAHGQLRRAGIESVGPLHSAAGGYHAAVRVLRQIVATRVARLVQPAAEGSGADLDPHTCPGPARATGGCAPRAA